MPDPSPENLESPPTPSATEGRRTFREPLEWIRNTGIVGLLVGGVGVMLQDSRLFWWSVAFVYIGAALVATDVACQPWFWSKKHTAWRRLIISAIIGLFLWFNFMIVFVAAPVHVNATFSSADKSVGTTTAGIGWRPAFSELSITISNPTELNYEDILLVLKCDKPIAAIGSMAGHSDVSFTPPVAQFRMDVTKGQTGQMVNVPLQLLATDLGYQLHCGRLAARDFITVVAAVADVNISTNKQGGVFDKDYISIGNSASDGSYWYGWENSDSYVKCAPVSVISINGTYNAQRKRHISLQIKPVNFNDLMPKH